MGVSNLSMSNNRIVRTGVLCLLYFAQGFPWGFATVALLSVLSEAGHSKEKTAAITGLAVIPWTFKFFWAPLIDSVQVPSYGLRRPWIAIAQLGMALTLFGVWFTGQIGESTTLTFIAWVFFAHNCFASLQDVATDALAVDLLEDSERGRVNGLMWGSKLFGTAVGGAGFGRVIATWDIATAVVIQAGLIFAIFLVVLTIRERPGEKGLPGSKGSRQAPEGANAAGFFSVLSELKRALSLKTTFLAAVMACTVNLCEGLYAPLTTDVFVQGLQWTATAYSDAAGTYGVLGELLGAIGGGLLCDRFGRRRMAGLGLILTSATLLTFGLTSAHWGSDSYPAVLLIPLFRGFFALTTVSLFSLYMKISWTGAAACQFTLYMALSNLGYKGGAKLNELNQWLASWGYQTTLTNGDFYVLAGCLALIPLTILPWLRPDSVVQKRIAETPMSTSAPDG